MSNPLQGWTIISRSNLRSMVQESNRWEREFREKKTKAVQEFYQRIKGTSDNKKKMLIFKEVAAKYGFREEWFIDQVRF